MNSVSRKIHSRRRLAALSFLSNISLDGTHRDTNLEELNFNIKINKTSKCYSLHVSDSKRHSEPSKPIDVESKSSEALDEIKDIFKAPSDFEGKGIKRRGSECKDIESTDRFYDNRQTRNNKDRVHKFVCEAKARLCNLSQKRKLSHQKSIESYGLPSGNSTESLGKVPGCSQSRKASLCPSQVSFPLAVEVKCIKTLKDYKYEAERVVLVSKRKSPVVLYSVISFNKLQGGSRVEMKLEGSRRRHASSRQLTVISDGSDPFDLLSLLGIEKPEEGHDVSYGNLLAPSNYSKKKCYDTFPESDTVFRFLYQMYSLGNAKLSTPPNSYNRYSENDYGCNHSWPMCFSMYHPNLLDDPELIAGKHSTLLVFPSYITSVIDYVKPSDLKKDLNDKFKERFPQVQLTLSKLRSLKREMYKIAKLECNIDLSVVAQAFVYFEKLILKIMVNKHNRKHCAGACLLLSAKLNDVRGVDLRYLLEKIETVFRINRKDLICLEFGVLVALEFSLLLSTSEILPHYQRLMYES